MFAHAAKPHFVNAVRRVAASPATQSIVLRSKALASHTTPLRMKSTIQTILTEKSYAPIGHYSQAFVANGQVWVAGQVAADRDGNLIAGSMTDKAHQICRNTREILKAANSTLEDVVKVTVYTTDFSLLGEFNEVYNQYFSHKPPRTSMQVSKLPLDVEVEVDVTAIVSTK